jgi:hypothetical protein
MSGFFKFTGGVVDKKWRRTGAFFQSSASAVEVYALLLGPSVSSFPPAFFRSGMIFPVFFNQEDIGMIFVSFPASFWKTLLYWR